MELRIRICFMQQCYDKYFTLYILYILEYYVHSKDLLLRYFNKYEDSDTKYSYRFSDFYIYFTQYFLNKI